MTAERKRIDWEQVRQRLAASQAALDRALATDPEQLATVYRERAARLARPRVSTALGATLRVLVCLVGRERYALEFADLAAVLPFAGCAHVPGSPPELLGVANINGDIRSVLDLGRLLSVAAVENAPAGNILVVRRHGRQTALRVDAVETIRQLSPEELANPDDGVPDSHVQFLRGWTADRLRVLNTDALFAHSLLTQPDRTRTTS